MVVMEGQKGEGALNNFLHIPTSRMGTNQKKVCGQNMFKILLTQLLTSRRDGSKRSSPPSESHSSVESEPRVGKSHDVSAW